MSVQSGVNLALERAGKVVVERSEPFELALLSLPDCRLETILSSGANRPITIASVTARGDILYDDGSYTSHSLLVKQAGKDPVKLQQPSDLGKDHWAPVLSDDGAALVWKTRQPASRLVVRDLESGSEQTVPLDSVPLDYEPIAADIAADEFVLGKFSFHVLVIDSKGATQWAPKTAIGVATTADALSFRRINDGWAAWSRSGPARLEWATRKGSGEREFPLSSIESLSVDPAGERIAVSLSAATRMNTDEAVLILRTSDGKELFHRILPKFSRVRLAFLGDSHLAMNSKGGVDVLRIPPSLAALDPAPAAGATTGGKPTDANAQHVVYAEAMAKGFGLKLEEPSPSTATDLLGTWNLVDVGEHAGCGWDEPFIEFRSDGFAYEPGTKRKKGASTVGERFIAVTEED
ncbi:MAG: hypothetical protein ABR587_13570, partial [Candidatus Binatia bacterium]